jgi:hypothetical protein
MEFIGSFAPGFLMETIHILRRDSDLGKESFHPGDDLMRLVRLAGTDLPAPGFMTFPDELGVGQKTLDGYHPHGVDFFPHPSRPAECGDPRLGRNTGTGEYRDPLALQELLYDFRWIQVVFLELAIVS